MGINRNASSTGIALLRARFVSYCSDIRGSYWFVPSLGVVAGILAAYFAILQDRNGIVESHYMFWLRETSPAGARALLSTLAGAIITVAGVSFSITIVALTLASSQFGPRLLRNFMRDGGNQFVLATFLSTFAYSMVVLRSIQDNAFVFVPHLAIAMASGLALFNVVVLIYFIHHIASTISASHVIKSVSQELDQTIDRLHPNSLATKAKQPNCDVSFDSADCVRATSSGYIQVLDIAGLLKIADTKHWAIKIESRPGQFVTRDTPLAQIVRQKKSKALAESDIELVNSAIILGASRTPEQDVEFLIHQLVEVALRALSPGINDPFTALDCIDRLGEALIKLTQRQLSPTTYSDDDNTPLLILKPTTFAGLADAAFDQLRQYGCSSMAVSLRMLEVIALIIPFAQRDEDLVILAKHAKMISKSCASQHKEEHDQADLKTRNDNIEKLLDQ